MTEKFSRNLIDLEDHNPLRVALMNQVLTCIHRHRDLGYPPYLIPDVYEFFRTWYDMRTVAVNQALNDAARLGFLRFGQSLRLELTELGLKHVDHLNSEKESA